MILRTITQKFNVEYKEYTNPFLHEGILYCITTNSFGYHVTHFSTGLAVSTGDTIKKALKEFKNYYKKNSIDARKVTNAVHANLSKFPIINDYTHLTLLL